MSFLNELAAVIHTNAVEPGDESGTCAECGRGNPYAQKESDS